ncbi:hypothetical protein L9F63_014116, partial [Diploptera punctata]
VKKHFECSIDDTFYMGDQSNIRFNVQRNKPYVIEYAQISNEQSVRKMHKFRKIWHGIYVIKYVKA